MLLKQLDLSGNGRETSDGVLWNRDIGSGGPLGLQGHVTQTVPEWYLWSSESYYPAVWEWSCHEAAHLVCSRV